TMNRTGKLPRGYNTGGLVHKFNDGGSTPDASDSLKEVAQSAKEAAKALKEVAQAKSESPAEKVARAVERVKQGESPAEAFKGMSSAEIEVGLPEDRQAAFGKL